MATSTFRRDFYVTKEKTTEFIEEMTSSVAPTLSKYFHSHLVNENTPELKDKLLRALK